MTTRIERFQCLALAVVLGTGALAVCMFALSLTHGAIIECWRPAEARPKQLLISRGGTPVIKSYDDSGYAEFHTLDGKVSEPCMDIDNIAGIWLRARATDDESPYVRDSWRSRLQTIYHRGGAPTIWYFVEDGTLDHRGYLVGYNQTTKLKIGCVGRNGPRTDKIPENEQFCLVSDQILYPQAYIGVRVYYSTLGIRSPLYLLTADGLVAIGLEEEKVKVVRRDADVVSAGMGQIDSSAGMGQIDSREVLLVRTLDKVIISDVNGKELETFSLPVELRDIDWKWYGSSYGNMALLVRDLRNGHDLFWIDEAGKILRREHVVLHSDDSRPHKLFLQNLTTVGIGSPSLMVLAMALNPWDYPERPWGSMEYSAAVYQAFVDVRPGLFIVITMSMVLAYVCYRRQRKYGLPWTGVWTGFVLLFGLPAYFGYLAHRAWPVRLPCPNCGKQVPRDRPACFACGCDFPPPMPKGIEVFA